MKHGMMRNHLQDGAAAWVFVCACLSLLAITKETSAQQWTRFRGPNGTGVVDVEGIPTEWSEADYNFKTELPGIGHSAPVIWGNKVFLTAAYEDTAKRLVMCVDAEDGRILWKKEFDSKVHEKHLRNSFASPTPTVDKERVYVSWSSPEEYILLALTHEGEEVWRQNLGPYVSQHSCGPSPILYKDLVILGNDQDDDRYVKPNPGGVSSLVAFEAKTGSLRWKTDRKSDVVAYSTPCLYQVEGKPDELIFNSSAYGISSIDPNTGKTNWELSVFEKRSVSSPIIAEGLIFGSCGSGGGGNYVAAISPGSLDGSTAPKLAYKVTESAPYVPTPVVKDGLLFLWGDNGVVACVDAKTGESHWRKRVGGNYSGSPICVGDRLYCIAEDGVVVVLRASKDYELLARNPLNEESRSTPSVANGRLFLRTYSHLISVGGKKK